MTSNGKQFTVTHKMLTAVARDWSEQLKVASFCRWNLSMVFKICFAICFVACENSRPSSLPAQVAFREKDVCNLLPKIPY